MCDALKDLFTCVDKEKGRYECIHCGHVLSGNHVRRKIMHFLPEFNDGSTRICKFKKDVSFTRIQAMEAYVKGLNKSKHQRQEKRKRVVDV